MDMLIRTSRINPTATMDNAGRYSFLIGKIFIRKCIKAEEKNNRKPIGHLRTSEKAASFKGLSQQPELHRHFGKLGLEIRSANLLWHLKFPALRTDCAVG